MSIYRGVRLQPPLRTASRVEVTVDGRPLPHIVCHSPDGFNWGYPGSGPADLALSILAHHLGEGQTPREAKRFEVDHAPMAWDLHQSFKNVFVVRLDPEKDWEITSEQIAEWIASKVPQDMT